MKLSKTNLKKQSSRALKKQINAIVSAHEQAQAALAAQAQAHADWLARFGFYVLDPLYMDYLRADPVGQRVPKTIYRGMEKFFLGPVIEKDGLSYFMPVTSKSKGDDRYNHHVNYSYGHDFDSRFSYLYMVPVPTGLFRLRSAHRHYLYETELAAVLEQCRAAADAIAAKAQEVYQARVAGNDQFLNRNAVDFAGVERLAAAYCYNYGTQTVQEKLHLNQDAYFRLLSQYVRYTKEETLAVPFADYLQMRGLMPDHQPAGGFTIAAAVAAQKKRPTNPKPATPSKGESLAPDPVNPGKKMGA